MKRVLLYFIFAIFSIIVSRAQGFDVGAFNTRYIYGGYTLKNGLRFELQHSIFSEKITYQSIGIRLGYKRIFNNFQINGEIGGTSAWNGSYRTADIVATGQYRASKVIAIEAAVSPYYDSGYGYSTNYKVGCLFKISQAISIMGYYTTIPEYRKSEARLRGGFGFRVLNLYVQPNLSVPVSGDSKLKNIRTLFDFQYEF